MKFMYKTHTGEVRCGTAPSIEAMQAKHWVDPATVKPAPRLPRPRRDIVDYDAGTIVNPSEAEERAAVADRASLRRQVQHETDAAWLARTDAQRWKIVLRILKAIEQRI